MEGRMPFLQFCASNPRREAGFALCGTSESEVFVLLRAMSVTTILPVTKTLLERCAYQKVRMH